MPEISFSSLLQKRQTFIKQLRFSLSFKSSLESIWIIGHTLSERISAVSQFRSKRASMKTDGQLIIFGEFVAQELSAELKKTSAATFAALNYLTLSFMHWHRK